MTGPSLILIDFDGTLTKNDIGDMVCERFAPPTWRLLDQQWLRGELSLTEAQKAMWALCRGERSEVLAYVKEVSTLREGVDRLLDAAEASATPVWLVSGGFDFYIEAILGDRLGRFARTLYNRATFVENRIEIEFPYKDAACSRCAICKGKLCWEALNAPPDNQPGPLAFIGDGSSDFCVLYHGPQLARIFAVEGGLLQQEAQVLSRPVVPFSTLAEVADALFVQRAGFDKLARR